MRMAFSSGARVTLNIVTDWPIDVVSADLTGAVSVTLPASFGGSNRPRKVHVVYFPGIPTVGASVASVLNAGPNGVADAPGAGVAGLDVTFTINVPLPLPTGTVTVLAIGEFDV